MSRIGFFYPPSSMPAPIDPATVWTSPRGLTGSEGSFVRYAVEMAELGHSVTVFTNTTSYGRIGKAMVCPYDKWEDEYSRQGWDALCSWMTPEPLKHARPGPVRLFNQQVSDFGGCEPGWEAYVDFLAPLSDSHARHMRLMTSLPADRWRVMNNGVDMDEFSPGEKIPGRMVWASSHDRGLHWLLEAFPRIRAAAPGSELHVFYNFAGVRAFASWENRGPLGDELGRRSRYVLEAIRRLEGKGVVVHESVSRDRIRREMASAEVLPYPLDPVRYTETFGVTVLEACASGTVPVICGADAFAELWGPASVMVPPPYSENKDAFVAGVVGVLQDGDLRASMARVGREHARRFSWPVLASRLDDFLSSGGRLGLPQPVWSEP